MRVFRHLQAAQDCLVELLSTYDPELGPKARAALAADIAGAASCIIQVRQQIVHRHLVMTGVAETLVEDAARDFSLVILLADDIVGGHLAGQDCDARVRAIGWLFEYRFALEEAPDGLWAAAGRAEIDVDAIDQEIRQRMLKLERRC